MSVLVRRVLARDPVDVEVFGGVDGQGMPSYALPVEIAARVVQEDALSVAADGSEVRTSLTVHVSPEVDVTPLEQDRVTWEGSRYIVVEVKRPRKFTGEVLFTRLRCRDE